MRPAAETGKAPPGIGERDRLPDAEVVAEVRVVDRHDPVELGQHAQRQVLPLREEPKIQASRCSFRAR